MLTGKIFAYFHKNKVFSAVVFDSIDVLKSQGVRLNISLDTLMDWLGQTSFIESVYSQQFEE